jgi:hypothetical protein
MKRFHSRIEALKRVREQSEKLARLQAAVCQSEKQKADQRVAEVDAKIAVVAAHRQHEAQIEIMQSIVNSTARLEAEKRIAVAAQSEARAILERAIQKVAAAKTELKIADTHIDRERAEHRRQSRIEEENDRQENSAQRFSRS